MTIQKNVVKNVGMKSTLLSALGEAFFSSESYMVSGDIYDPFTTAVKGLSKKT